MLKNESETSAESTLFPTIQFPASLGHSAGRSQTILMNLGWLFSFQEKKKKSQDWGNFYLVSSFIGTAGWHFSNKTNHDHLALLQTFIFLMHPSIAIFQPHYFLWKKFKKILQYQKGEKIKTFSATYKIHLLFISRHFWVVFGQPEQVFCLVTSDCSVL